MQKREVSQRQEQLAQTGGSWGSVGLGRRGEEADKLASLESLRTTPWEGSTQSLALSFPRSGSQEASWERLGTEVSRQGGKNIYFLSFYGMLCPMLGNSQAASHLIIVTTL